MFSAIVLACFRALGLLTALPCIQGVSLLTSKLLLGAVIVLCAPLNFDAPEAQLELILLSAAGEFALGFLVGLPFALIVNGAELCAELFDLSRGQALSLIYDPLSNVNQAQTAVFIKNFVLASLLMQGGFDSLIRNLYSSFQSFPPFWSVMSGAGVLELIQAQLRLLILGTTAAFQFFLPLAFAFFGP